MLIKPVNVEMVVQNAVQVLLLETYKGKRYGYWPFKRMTFFKLIFLNVIIYRHHRI